MSHHDHDTDESPPTDGPLHGLLAEFDSPGALKTAAAAVRDAGYRSGLLQPVPVHGIDPAIMATRCR
jgi:hypothetical protein